MAEHQEVRSVLVTNISPSANEKTVSDFFSFCGKISQLFLKKEEGKDTSSAVIQFETESAAKTALLLTNALIVDRPITVTAYLPSSETAAPSLESHGTPVDQSNITQKDFNGVPDEDRSKTSVIASLIAAGYRLTENALEKAKEADERNNFSARAKIVVDQMVVKVHEIDVQYGISDKANNAVKAVQDTAHSLDAQYGISDKTAAAVSAIKSGAQVGLEVAQSGLNKAQENPTIKKGVDSVKSTAAVVSGAVSQGVNQLNNTVNDITVQTRHEIDENKAKSAHPDTTSTPVPATMEPEQQQ